MPVDPGLAAPLFFRVTLDQFFINICAYQRQCLLLEVTRMGNMQRADLVIYFLLCFGWCFSAPQLIKVFILNGRLYSSPL